MINITLDKFSEYFQEKLGDRFETAKRMREVYGDSLSFDLTNVLLHASDQDKIQEVLDILVAHANDHLLYQHPETRGQIANDVGVNKTQEMFLNLCKNVLNLKENTTQ